MGLRAFLQRLYCKLLPVSRDYLEARRRTDAVIAESTRITEAINKATKTDEDPIRSFVESLSRGHKNDSV